MLGNKKQVTQCYLLLSCRKVCYYIRYEMALAFADGEQKIRGILEQKLFYCQTDKRRDQHDEKKNWTLEVIRRLKEEYPDADCTLDYDEAWKASCQCTSGEPTCTDARVNVVVEDLYAKFTRCKCTCRCAGGGDRRDRKTVWTQEKVKQETSAHA